MYVLLYTDDCNKPCLIQGDLNHINKQLAELVSVGTIDRESYDYYNGLTLWGVEDNVLTKVENWFVESVPVVIVEV